MSSLNQKAKDPGSASNSSEYPKRRMRSKIRSEDDFARDLCLILESNLSEKSKEDFIGALLWGWSTRGQDKYKGQKCSVDAQERFKEYEDELSRHKKRSGNKKPVHGLIHDHAVPRKVNRCYLMQNGIKGIDEALDFLVRRCEAVIITKDEDNLLNQEGLKQKMPEQLDEIHPFSRYDYVGIELSEYKLGEKSES